MTSTKGWILDEIIEEGDNFHHVERVSATAPDLLDKIKKYETNGVPLVIEGFHKHSKWPQRMFTIDEFVETYEGNDINVRNIHNRSDRSLPLRDFIAKCRVVTPYKTDTEFERFYGKDIECPKTWEDWLQKGDVIPKALISKGPEDVFRHLPDTDANAVETLMCYIGIGDTFTPCHKDSCASSGQNLMCYTEKGGSSFWFMTASSSAQKAADYFQTLGHELDHESYFVKIDELSRAPFKVYILEQKLGDMVLVPPRSCHQVINHGGITFKTSWSRMTTKGLKSAFFHELPIYRRVCRPEIYQIKGTTYHSLLALTTELENCLSHSVDSNGHVLDELKELLLLFEAILTEEYDEETAKQTPSNDGYRVTCDFCLAEIFQSYFECHECTEPSGESLHLCIGCYSEGRRCQCSVAMKPMQSRDFHVLQQASSSALRVIQTYEERFNRKTPDFSSELDAIRDEIPPLFRAGCVLYKLQQLPISNRQKRERLCDMRKNHIRSTHLTDYSNLVSCQKCRFPTCYKHILSEYKVHASEALLLVTPGTSEASYHDIHTNAKARFENDLQLLDKVRRKGDRPRGSQLYTMLTQNSEKYAFCNPANHLLKPGWYDTVRSSQPLIPLMTHRRQSIKEPIPEPSGGSLSASTPPSSATSNTCHDEATASSQSSVDLRPTKRRFIVFVEVPSAPYDISRFKRPHLEDVERPQPTNLTRPADRRVTRASKNKRPDEDPPRISTRKGRRAANVPAATQDKAASSKLLQADTSRPNPPNKLPGTSSSTQRKPASIREVVGKVPQLSGSPKRTLPKFKKNLEAVTSPSHQSPVENVDSQHTDSGSSPHSHGDSPNIECTAHVYPMPTDDEEHDYMQHAPSMTVPMQEPDALPPWRSRGKAMVSSVAATADTLVTFTPLFPHAARFEDRPAMTPLPNQRYFQQHSAPFHPHNERYFAPSYLHNQRTLYQQQSQQHLTPSYWHHRQPSYQQQYVPPVSYHPATAHYNDAFQQFYPSHYYTGYPYPDTDAYYDRTTQSTSFHSPEPVRRVRQPRLERQRWDRDPHATVPSQTSLRRVVSEPLSYPRRSANPKDSRKPFFNKGPSPKQHRPRSTPYGNGERRTIHRSTFAQMSRPPMLLKRLSFPESDGQNTGASHYSDNTEQQRETLDHGMVPASPCNGDAEQATRRIDSQPEAPIPIASLMGRINIPHAQEPENSPSVVDGAQKPDDTDEDDWEDGYEKADDVEASSPPTFRMEEDNWTQDDAQHTNSNDYGYDLSNNPWNASPSSQ